MESSANNERLPKFPKTREFLRRAFGRAGSESALPPQPQDTVVHEPHNFTTNDDRQQVRTTFSSETGEDDRIVVQREGPNIGFYDTHMNRLSFIRTGDLTPLFFDYLMRIYAVAEESPDREYRRDALTEKAGFRRAEAERAYSILSSVMPPEVFSVAETPARRIRLGKLAFADAIPTLTSEEAPKEGRYVSPTNYEQEFAKRIELVDKGKEDLSLYSRASFIVTSSTETTHYQLDLDSPESFVLARVVEALGDIDALAEFGVDSLYTPANIARVVWQKMHTNERAAYAGSGKRLLAENGAACIEKITREMLEIHTKDMGLNTELNAKHMFERRWPNAITVEYEDTQRVENEPSDSITVIELHDPELEKQQLDMTEQQFEQTVVRANRYLAALNSCEPYELGRDTAVKLLDFLMTRQGRLAMRQATRSSEKFSNIHRVHDYLESHMTSTGATSNAVLNKQIRAFMSKL